MEIRVNKGTSHPIEILSCGTSSCITIEEAAVYYLTVWQQLPEANKEKK